MVEDYFVIFVNGIVAYWKDFLTESSPPFIFKSLELPFVFWSYFKDHLSEGKQPSI